VSVHVFGVRHHGPGSARSLRAALEALQPDSLLVEGPPDADELLAFVGHEQLKPPVALLIYPPDQPRKGVFYPFAEFSPEWQALLYAKSRSVPVRFMDLPQQLQMSTGHEEREPGIDPVATLSRLAGYDEPEEWWEQHVEQRLDAEGMFAAVLEGMSALRSGQKIDLREQRREAFMRRCIREENREGRGKIAVVCGAWHAPALVELPPAKQDDALLKGLPKTKVEATWIPWTHSRLSYRSGYGAGVQSPGWYAHLWTAPDRAVIRWAVNAAQLLRGEDLDASSANVIETVRLAETLAALRDRPQPGLPELRDAALSVLCAGDGAALQLIHDRLEVGERLGEVPAEAPSVPLQRDLETLQRRLRLKASTEIKPLELDLRKENDREKSRLLHRLQLLGIDWGEPAETRASRGTFREEWTLQWLPELALKVVEASVFGQTVESAAAGAAKQRAAEAQDLPALALLLDRAIVAELDEAISLVLSRLQELAALHAGAQHLMKSLAPLARAARYGDVRGTKVERVLPVLEGLFERALVALPGACASLDDDAAAQMLEAVDSVEETLRLVDRPEWKEEWLQVLRSLTPKDAVHGLLRGRFARILLDSKALDAGALQILAQHALSPATPAPQASSWIEGLLRGGALAVLHQDGVWRALDGWLAQLPEEAFVEALPLVRRAFASFQPPERRQMGEKVKRFCSGESASAAEDDLDERRVALVRPILARILGDG
jgi:hypothetical protein